MRTGVNNEYCVLCYIGLTKNVDAILTASTHSLHSAIGDFYNILALMTFSCKTTTQSSAKTTTGTSRIIMRMWCSSVVKPRVRL